MPSTSTVIDESLEGFIAYDDLGEGTREPEVATLRKVFIRKNEGTDEKTGDGWVSRFLVWRIEPTTRAIASRDNAYEVSWRLPNTDNPSKRGLYGIAMATIEAAADKKIKTPQDMASLVGQNFLFVEIPPEHPMLKVLGKFQANVKNNLVTVQKAPEGWEKSVPADIEQQKLAAQAKWAEQQELKAAGQGGPQAEEVTSAPADPESTDYGDHLGDILDFYDGQPKDSVTKDAAKHPKITGLPTEFKKDVLTNRAGKKLEAQGYLTLDEGIYKLAA